MDSVVVVSCSSSFGSALLDVQAAEGERLLAADLASRFNGVLNNLMACFWVVEQSMSYNDCIRALREGGGQRSLDGCRRSHPFFELLINESHRRASAAAEHEPTEVDVNVAFDAAERALADALQPIRGRPQNHLIRYHVLALMVLIRDTTGVLPTASNTKNSVYDRHMVSDGGRMIVDGVQRVAPTVTEGTLVGIVRAATASGELDGKTFSDFFPFEFGRLDPVSGLPVPVAGKRLDSFSWLRPIYIS